MHYSELSPEILPQDLWEEVKEWDSGLDFDSIPEGGVLDAEALREFRDVLEDDFDRYIEGFIRNASENVSQIRKSLEINDFNKLRQVAHPLKGSAAQVGAYTLSAIAGRCEFLGVKENKAYLEKLVPILEDEFNKVRNELRKK